MSQIQNSKSEQQEEKTFSFPVAVYITLEIEATSKEEAAERVLRMSGDEIDDHTTIYWGLHYDYQDKEVLVDECFEC